MRVCRSLFFARGVWRESTLLNKIKVGLLDHNSRQLSSPHLNPFFHSVTTMASPKPQTKSPSKDEDLPAAHKLQIGKVYRNVTPLAIYSLPVRSEGEQGKNKTGGVDAVQQPQDPQKADEGATASGGCETKLIICKGSVVDFDGDSIVNAANEGCLGGGGVDGAISARGGRALMEARYNLPIVPGTRGVRCPTGGAVLTVGGNLRAKYCIHAVGPMFYLFGSDTKSQDEADKLLKGAYKESLERANEKDLTNIGFSLLSSGIFRGSRSLEDVLRIGIEAIVEYVESKQTVETKSVKGDADITTPKDALTQKEEVKKGASSEEASKVGEESSASQKKLAEGAVDEGKASKAQVAPTVKKVVTNGVEEIYLVAFLQTEVRALVGVARDYFSKKASTSKKNPGSQAESGPKMESSSQAPGQEAIQSAEQEQGKGADSAGAMKSV